MKEYLPLLVGRSEAYVEGLSQMRISEELIKPIMVFEEPAEKNPFEIITEILIV